jgi:hypothetical protein
MEGTPDETHLIWKCRPPMDHEQRLALDSRRHELAGYLQASVYRGMLVIQWLEEIAGGETSILGAWCLGADKLWADAPWDGAERAEELYQCTTVATAHVLHLVTEDTINF